MKFRSLLRIVTVGSCVTCLLTGCQSIYFPYQAAKGQLELMTGSRNIDDVLVDKLVDPQTRSRLLLAAAALEFAEDHLGLDAKGNYERYTVLNRPYVVWNVFVAPEFSTDLNRHCFPVAGCVTYRGYFKEHDAKKVAEKIRGKGDDVAVVGVAAYTTLGWFKDPLLDTFLLGSEAGLIRTLYHELAHLHLYVLGDTDWNESYASAVAELGIQALSKSQLLSLPPLAHDAQWATRKRRVERLILTARADLAVLYDRAHSDQVMRVKKSERVAMLKAAYQNLVADWPRPPYQRLMSGPLNNASLALVQSYSGLTPRFIQLHEALGGNYERFFEAVRRLSLFDASQRRDPDLWARVIDALNQESTGTGDQ